MKITKLSYLGALLFSILFLSGCNKDWLDAKPNKSLIVPLTIPDYQALLDNSSLMNQNAPGLNVISDDNMNMTDASYLALSGQGQKNAYIWGSTENFYGSDGNSDWALPYARILNDNITLDGIKTIKPEQGTIISYNNVKGSALFYRCLDFFNLAQEFCKTYALSTASTDLGLPLRTSSDINLSVSRSSVQQTYDQIINDLLTAASLLPNSPLYPTRPSRPAVFGLLARTYLAQENYAKAALYADSCLQIQSSLLDFNTLTKTSTNPIPRFNKEVIFQYTLVSEGAFRTNVLIVDPGLYQSFAANDLRTAIYFTTVPGGVSFKGSYNGTLLFFGGLATDEMYLIRAECYARAGNTLAAMGDLNTLLQARWKTGTYVNMVAATPDIALAMVLNERRKELCFRGLRWTDLQRLNKDPGFQIVISRTVSGQAYTLPPNSLKYVFPLDGIEIQLGGLLQNPR
jgi:hypothetical protein